jgi:hypothetical protein
MTFSAGISDDENNRCFNVNTRSPDPRNFWCITSRSGTRMKMKSILLVCLLAILSGGCSLDPGPLRTPEKPFHGDGCSCFPDLDYGDCCMDHDRAYWRGGTPAQRRAADKALRRCIAEKNRPLLAHVVYWGVRIGGHGWLPTPWRWGFGHRWPHGYN